MKVPPMPVLSDAKIRALKPKEKPYKQADFDGLFLLVKPMHAVPIGTKGSKLRRGGQIFCRNLLTVLDSVRRRRMLCVLFLSSELQKSLAELKSHR